MASRIDTILYNGSGAVDPTAAAAIRKILRENMSNDLANAGEIWSFEDGKLVLVVAVNNRIMNYTNLLPDDNGYCDIHIGAWHANSAMIAHTWQNNAVRFVRSLTDDEFDKVLITIGSNLGLIGIAEVEEAAEKDQIIKELNAQIEKLQSDYKNLNDYVAELKAKVGMPSDEAVRLEAKIEALESMNDKLLAKLLG